VHGLWILGWNEELQDRGEEAAVFLTRYKNLEALLKLLLLEFPYHLKMNKGPGFHHKQLLLDVHCVDLCKLC
jgi:hypothetical protein